MKGYSHEEAIKSFKQCFKVLEIMNEYHDKCYMIHYAFTEVSYIYDGETLSEDLS